MRPIRDRQRRPGSLGRARDRGPAASAPWQAR